MIYYPLSFWVRSGEEALVPGVTLSADGQALVRVTVNGLVGMKPSTGAAGEVFAGFAQVNTSMQTFLEGTAAKVQTITLNGAGVAELSFAPLTGSAHVWNNTDNVAVAAADYTLVNASFTSALNAGKVITLTYVHAISVLQARTMAGDVTPGGYAGYQTSTVSVARQGVIYTNQFDTAVNWAAATGIKLAANGKLTDQTGSGTLLPIASVKSLPSADYPYLGVDFTS